MKTRIGVFEALLGIILIMVLLAAFCGCYSEKKANIQHGKAVATYPKIGAQFCAITYPCKDSVIIHGKDSIQVDTLWGEGEVIIDTVKTFDTIRITKVVQLPGKVITKIITRIDTIYREDVAKLKVCDIERGQAIALLDKKTIESDKWRKIAKQRFWIIVGLGLAIGVGLYFKFAKSISLPKL